MQHWRYGANGYHILVKVLLTNLQECLRTVSFPVTTDVKKLHKQLASIKATRRHAGIAICRTSPIGLEREVFSEVSLAKEFSSLTASGFFSFCSGQVTAALIASFVIAHCD
jgi:hypothetical protein